MAAKLAGKLGNLCLLKEGKGREAGAGRAGRAGGAGAGAGAGAGGAGGAGTKAVEAAAEVAEAVEARVLCCLGDPITRWLHSC